MVCHCPFYNNLSITATLFGLFFCRLNNTSSSRLFSKVMFPRPLFQVYLYLGLCLHSDTEDFFFYFHECHDYFVSSGMKPNYWGLGGSENSLYLLWNCWLIGSYNCERKKHKRSSPTLNEIAEYCKCCSVRQRPNPFLINM